MMTYVTYVTFGGDDLMVRLGIAQYLGENAIKSDVEYFKASRIFWPLIKLHAWIVGFKCKTCYYNRLLEMGMVKATT